MPIVSSSLLATTNLSLVDLWMSYSNSAYCIALCEGISAGTGVRHVEEDPAELTTVIRRYHYRLLRLHVQMRSRMKARRNRSSLVRNLRTTFTRGMPPRTGLLHIHCTILLHPRATQTRTGGGLDARTSSAEIEVEAFIDPEERVPRASAPDGDSPESTVDILIDPGGDSTQRREQTPEGPVEQAYIAVLHGPKSLRRPCRTRLSYRVHEGRTVGIGLFRWLPSSDPLPSSMEAALYSSRVVVVKLNG
ncbi:hypothetical protein NUW54_g2356 [Trametes sanguinea]|uniref:Uncharacterized protein n=1 Tax=Trametes sanguinea TaxID=158606 RepID=A0ACC1Q3U4_9APHY|nr:hypothetical protein NUW54_g2356 [Trametes sanguinea]